jgi:hypothetical protein
MTETIMLRGRPAVGFALGSQPVGVSEVPASATPVLAAVMTGAAAGLLAHVLKAPVWGAIMAGAGAAFLAKVGIDRVA